MGIPAVALILSCVLAAQHGGPSLIRYFSLRPTPAPPAARARRRALRGARPAAPAAGRPRPACLAPRDCGKKVEMMAELSDIGLIGLGTMGRSLVLNMADRGFRVAGFNRTRSVTEQFAAGLEPGQETSVEIEPGKILIVTKAGVVKTVLPAGATAPTARRGARRGCR